jgi:SNF2 family DNA or RNA helicase
MEQKFANMTVSLMPHQILGVAFMLSKEKDKRYRGGLLCDAMGLGKVNPFRLIVKEIRA